MNYSFSIKEFKKNFKVQENNALDTLRLTHRQNINFKLYPYKTGKKNRDPIVTELDDVACGFFRKALNINTKSITFDELINNFTNKNSNNEIYSESLDFSELKEDEFDLLKDIIKDIYFNENEFVANSLALYPYQTKMNNKSSEALLDFLYDVLDIDDLDCLEIKKAMEESKSNVLESMLIQAIESMSEAVPSGEKKYFKVNTKFQKLFKKDLMFMLKADMTSIDDLESLLELYYFNYVSQTCIALDGFCNAKRDNFVPLYFALDWEKVSANRQCCKEGWSKLQEKIDHMFTHAITLEIINQQEDSNQMLDYIELNNYIKEHPEADYSIAKEIQLAEETYTSYIGDCKDFDKIENISKNNSTDYSLQHLFKSVEKQFIASSSRMGPRKYYNEKFSEFCRNRWVKNRRKSGLVLNLTERDVIFLTKLAIEENDRIRLLDLFKEFEYRGVYLDNTSKEYLQDFFTKLNLIDKKSDSGDAQYVKRIL